MPVHRADLDEQTEHVGLAVQWLSRSRVRPMNSSTWRPVPPVSIVLPLPLSVSFQGRYVTTALSGSLRAGITIMHRRCQRTTAGKTQHSLCWQTVCRLYLGITQ
jgi:hypothetical protein